jgi:ATP-dependent DNA helicase RecQ
MAEAEAAPRVEPPVLALTAAVGAMSGSAAPSTVNAALETLGRVFGYTEFKGPQQAIIEHVVAGGDALVLMPTGGGKSLCYQIPSLIRPGVGIVVSPLIALMQDQVAALKEAGVRAAFLNSSMTSAEAAAVERAVREGSLDLLYVAPERLLTERCLGMLARTRIALIAIDEAHCVSQWGHDFRPEYIGLSILAERFPEAPRIALTATADAATREEIVKRLVLEGGRTFATSFDRPNIRYRLVEKDDPRRQLLTFIKGTHDGDSGIVYCSTRAKVDQTATFLADNGITAVAYHAGLETRVRSDVQARFQRDDGVVVVATIAFGMGIDKPDVRFVAHLDLPRSVESYYQETGRAGRDGLPADAWMTYGLADVVQQRRFIEASDAEAVYKRVAGVKLDAMLALCETLECRRVRLLAYFGERSQACGNCDNCLLPPEALDGTVIAQKFLSAVYRCQKASGFPFGAQHLIDVLRGAATEKIRRFGHDRLPLFGAGSDLSVKEWRSVARQLTTAGLVHVDAERFNAVLLTEASRDVLKGQCVVSLRKWREEPASSARRRGASGSAAGGASRSGGRHAALADLDPAAAAVFQRLRAWRARQAQTTGVPAYVIFHDATLREIAQNQPKDRDELGAIAGVGARKLESYGEVLLETVRGA